MARIDKIVDFAGSNHRLLSGLRPGEQCRNYFMPPIDVIDTATNLPVPEREPTQEDLSIEQAEARFFYAKLGAILDDSLPRGHWMIDWRDRTAPKPTLRLSHDLFAHVTEALERA